MALEVTKGEGFWHDRGTKNGWHYVLELAKAISGSAHWTIIDSYAPSASPQRVYGDPIVGGLWGGLSKTADQANAWFVAEQNNPTGGRPAMQAKFQCSAGSLFNDPSGHDYGWETTGYVTAVRFAPFGGWDSDPSAPDFANPTTKASQNLRILIDHLSAPNGNWYNLLNDDYIMTLMYCTDGYWYSIPFYLGEYTPMFALQDTPEHPCYMYWGSNGEYAVSPTFGGIADTLGEFLNERRSYTTPIVWLPDENGNIQEWRANVPPMNDGFIDGRIVPNEFDPSVGVDLIEVPFVGDEIGTSPDSRIIGSHKHVWRGWGIGNGGFLSGRQYLTLGANVACAIVEWDGVSNL